MSFSMSSRFPEHLNNCSPSPTTYNISSTFDGSGIKNCIPWVQKHSPFVGHKCDENCSLNIGCAHFQDQYVSLSKKRLNPKRLSLDPQFNKGSIKKNQQKIFQSRKPRLSLDSMENKENLQSPQRKNGSNIPLKLKSNVTLPQAPSFVTNPRNIHSCFPCTEEDDTFNLTSNFNRHSFKRKSIKPVRNPDKGVDDLMGTDKMSEESMPKRNRPFNKSYTILPRIIEGSKEEPNVLKNTETNTLAGKTVTGAEQGAIPKKINNITDDMKRIDNKPQILKRYRSTEDNSKYADGHQNIDAGSSFSFSKVLKKDNELAKELSSSSRTKRYYEISTEKECMSDLKQEQHIDTDQNVFSAIKATKEVDHVAGQLRSHDIFALGDCNIIFLVTEEFIDDEYDSYVKDLKGAKGYLQVLQNKELYEMTKLLVRVYLEKQESFETTNQLGKMKSSDEAKMEKSNEKKFRKPKRKRNGIINNKNIWDEVEKIVRTVIMELKGEFQTKIYQKTNEKLDQLVSELKNVVLKANEDIGDTCERTTKNLISRLENIALKT